MVVHTAAWLVCMLLASGCGEPSVDVLAMWVDGIADDDGKRRVRIYDAGARDLLLVRPDIPGSGVDPMQIGVDDRARGVALSGADSTVWIEYASGRRVTLSAEAVGRTQSLMEGFAFAPAGDAMVRQIALDPELPPTWLLATLSGPDALRVHEVAPPTVASENRTWKLVGAADAPVMVLAEVGGGPPAVSGEVLAFAYPSAEGQGPRIDDLRPLARGRISGVGVGVDHRTRLASPACPDRLCMVPSGRVLYAMAGGGTTCDLLRWTWVEAESVEADTAPERLEVPCPAGDPTSLLAALDDDLVVLDDPHRLHLVDLSAGQVQSIPKPDGVLITDLAARGRVLLILAPQGVVLRIDAAGPRMVSGLQSACTYRGARAVSPSGAWVIQSCNDLSGDLPLDGVGDLVGQLQRISVLGSELYAGIPLEPIAIDDEGNALLYSVSASDEDGTPRGLFVLTGDGQLTRVDELEPFPGRVLVRGHDGVVEQGRFAAAGPA